jgi:hypothetical protein
MSTIKLWLTPIRFEDQHEQIVLLADRFELLPTEAGGRFLKLAKSVHPRMLVTFKSNLLLSEEAELACGVDELPFELGNGEPIAFGHDTLGLSHCAQAYLDRLPTCREMEQWIAAAVKLTADIPETMVEREWLELMSSWLQKGNLITLLREER